MIGGSGDDLIDAGDGNDTIAGGVGTDLLLETLDANMTLTDTTLIARGSDSISEIEQVQLLGGAGNNILRAVSVTQMNVILDGGDGDDSLIGGALGDQLLGGDGEDALGGRDGNDTIDGGNGNDRLYGELGNDRFNGGLGNDTMIGGAGIDTLQETVNANMTLTDTNLVARGTDSISEMEQVQLTGGAGNNILRAVSVTQMNVTLDGAAGHDSLIGGAIDDLLIGGDGEDALGGRDGNDTINGGNGNDRLYGELGDDTLIGGNGDDLLLGGSGADVFAIESLSGIDTISDFSDGVDYLSLANPLGFGDLSIVDNSAGTAAMILDGTNGNQLLAVVNNVSAADLTVEDFTDI